MATRKQELARKRNFFKFRLLGINFCGTPVSVMTDDERTLIAQIESNLTILKAKFNDNSRKLGFNVKDRCWCGKVATTTSKCKLTLGQPSCKEHENDIV